MSGSEPAVEREVEAGLQLVAMAGLAEAAVEVVEKTAAAAAERSVEEQLEAGTGR